MKRAVTLMTAAAAFLAPASAIAAPQLAAPLPRAHAAQASTTTTTTTTTTTAPTPGTPLNIASDRVALNAYASYLNALLKAGTIGQTNDTAFIATIAGPSGCKGALQPLTQPNEQVDTMVHHTLTVLGREMGDDLSISFDQSALPAFSKFASTLQKLHWTRLTGAAWTVKHYIDAQTAVLNLVPSNLCQDALYAATTPTVVPAGTKAFVKSYEKASLLADAAEASLLKMMQLYEASGEKALITRIASLATQVSTQNKSFLLQSGTALASTLEST